MSPCYCTSSDSVERWLAEWLAARLVLREGQRYLSLATNPAERIRRRPRSSPAAAAAFGR